MDVNEGTGLLLNIPQRPPELGRIRLGEKGARGEPVRLKTFRLTSGSKALLEAAAALYGGKVAAWQGAPDEGMWQLTTAVAELDILIPTNLRSVSQAYELWKGGACERRCDGTNAVTPKGSVPCICDAKGLDGPDRECEIMTRLSVMLPRVPGLGVWRLDTGGYLAATTLPSTLTLLSSLARGTWAHAVLRAEQRSKRERLPDGKVQTHRFVVPVLDLPGTTLGQLVPGADVSMPQIEAGERPAPLTARDRVAAARAAAESRPAESTAGGARDGTTDPEAEPPATSGSIELCGAVPEEDGLGMTLPCTRKPHSDKAPHVSEEGSWYDKVKVPA